MRRCSVDSMAEWPLLSDFLLGQKCCMTMGLLSSLGSVFGAPLQRERRGPPTLSTGCVSWGLRGRAPRVIPRVTWVTGKSLPPPREASPCILGGEEPPARLP